MNPFKFFHNEENRVVETIPSPIDITITRAIVTARIVTFTDCRDDMMYRQPDSQYVYRGYTSFTKDNIQYRCVRTLNDLLGRSFDNYILLHDAREIEGIEDIITDLRLRGATEMF